MNTTAKSLFELTASDLMSAASIFLYESQPLRKAADELLRAGVHGAPVVDASGRCVGVLSVSDLARWAARKEGPAPTRPRTCSHQEVHRSIHGEETTLCTLPAGTCSIQASKQLPDGSAVEVCREPHCVCLEWQMVEMESLPTEDVRHYMTSEPVAVDPDTPIRTIARRMLDTGVARVIVADSNGAPIGVVSASDLVAAVAGRIED